MFTHNGKVIQPSSPFTIGETSFPANWLSLATADDLAQHGIVFEADPARPLSDLKAEKLAELLGERMRAQEKPITVAGKQYPADSEYREVVANLARRKDKGKQIPANLRGSNGQPVSLTPTLLDQIEDAIAAQVQGAWDRYWLRYDAVQAAATAEEVAAVVW